MLLASLSVQENLGGDYQYSRSHSMTDVHSTHDGISSPDLSLTFRSSVLQVLIPLQIAYYWFGCQGTPQRKWELCL